MFERILYFFKDWWNNKPVSLSRGLRSSKWVKTRNEHLKKQNFCQWCGSPDNLEVHHIEPFHISPDRELDESNLITLCENKEKQCHFAKGHFRNWRAYNSNIVKQCHKNMKNWNKNNDSQG